MLPLQRYLDSTEIQVKGAAPSFAVAYEGDVDQGALELAFKYLCTRYPVLRARIQLDDQGHLLYVPPTTYPDVAFRQGGERKLREHALRPWDPTLALSQLAHIRGDHNGFVALRADHAIVDATHLATLFQELWSLYTDIVTGTVAPPEHGTTLPSAPNELLRSRAGLTFASSLLNPSSTPPVQLCEAIERRVRLSEDETVALVVAARAHGTTVHAIISGAILVALRGDGTATDPATMVCWQPINLRRRVNPPVGVTEVTNFGTRHRTKIAVPANANPIAIGRQVKDQLDRAVSRGELRKDPIQSPPPHLKTSIDQKLATVMISNAGVIPHYNHPSETEITDYLLVQSAQTVLFPTYGIYTYAGRLSLLVVYPRDLFNDTEVEGIVNRTVGLLREIYSAHE